MRLQANGIIDTSFPSMTTTFSLRGVHYIKPYDTNRLLICGPISFTTYNASILGGNLIRINNSDGTVDMTISNVYDTDSCSGVSTNASGQIFIASHNLTRSFRRFTNSGAIDAGFISYKFDRESGWPDKIEGEVLVQGDGKVLLGSHLTYVANPSWPTSYGRLVRFNTDGSIDSAFMNNLSGGFNDRVHALAIQGDGKILVGGRFSQLASHKSPNIIRLNSDYTHDTSFISPDVGYASSPVSINSVAVQSSGKLVIAGNFNGVTGAGGAFLIARLNNNGSFDSSWASYFTAGSSISTIKLQTGDKVLAVGAFASYGGSTANNIVRINSDGSFDATFVMGTGFNAVAYAMDLQSDGKIIISGAFTSYDGQAVDKIVRLNSNGTLDSSFTPPTGGIQLLKVLSSDKILGVTGSGASISLIRLNANGTLDSSFTPFLLNNATVLTVTEINGSYPIGTNGQGTSTPPIFRLNSDGSLDPNFFVPLKTLEWTPSVGAIIPISSNSFWIGGAFQRYNNQEVRGFIQVTAPP